MKLFPPPRWQVLMQSGEHPMLRRSGAVVSQHWFHWAALLSAWLSADTRGPMATVWIEPIGGAK